MSKNPKKAFSKSQNCVFNLYFHIIWIPKYRKRILTGDVELSFKKLLSDKASSIGVIVHALECMPDHVHLFIQCSQTHSIPNIVKLFKGFTSFHLRKQFPHLNKFKVLWAPAYYCESIGLISKETVIKYINNQKNF